MCRPKHLPFTVAFCFLAVLSAQEYRGRIQGTVTDPSNAVIVGARITLVNTATQVITTRTTADTGHYLFDVVEPGVYRVAIEADGFGRFQAERVVLQQRGDVTVDAMLTPGSVNETVTVTSQAPQVQSSTPPSSRSRWTRVWRPTFRSITATHSSCRSWIPPWSKARPAAR